MVFDTRPSVIEKFTYSREKRVPGLIPSGTSDIFGMDHGYSLMTTGPWASIGTNLVNFICTMYGCLAAKLDDSVQKYAL
jgi:hypothetical protein